MTRIWRWSTVVIVTALLLSGGPRLRAHDIPSDVTVHLLVKPERDRLCLLARVPLGAMRDIRFPLRASGDLDLARAEPALRDAAQLWIADGIALFEDDRPLGAPRIVAIRAALISDRSFVTYDSALSHVIGAPLADTTSVPADQALLDVLFEYAIRSDRSTFSIQPSLTRLGSRVVTSLRFLAANGSVRAFEYSGDPGLVRLDPRWHQAAASFVRFGFLHILQGPDHLLFVLCLVIPMRRLRPLVAVVTAFTAAHSITLVAAARGIAPDGLWFAPLVETAIAASIVFMALENILDLGGFAPPDPPTRSLAGTPRSPLRSSSSLTAFARLSSSRMARRWGMAFIFGLVHGFGFSFALRESLQYAGSHLLTSLLAFNLGVELGQIAVLLVLVPALHLTFRFAVAERPGIIVVSALVAHTAWHWTADRFDRLRQFGWPAVSAASIASAMRWAIAALLIVGVVWLFRRQKGHALDIRRGPGVSG